MGARRYNVNFDIYMEVARKSKETNVNCETKKRLVHIAQKLFILLHEEGKAAQERVTQVENCHSERRS